MRSTRNSKNFECNSIDDMIDDLDIDGSEDEISAEEEFKLDEKVPKGKKRDING